MVLAVLAMIALVGAGYVGRGLVESGEGESGTAILNRQSLGQPVTTSEPSTPRLSGTDGEPVTAVARALGPSVVVIKNGDELGSGVIYDSSGLIVTNAHVVGSAQSVTVTLNDGRSVEGAVVLGADDATDIAVVRVEVSEELPAARLAAGPPAVGDLVVALGSPFGLDQTITSGVVSAVNRPIQTGTGAVVNMVQTDAAINPGNSGGALANRHAEVVGINSMIFSQTGTNSGIGFAIPIAKAKSVADRLVAGEPVERAYLGVRTEAADGGAAGAQVESVESGSGADQAGLRAGDLVTAVDGAAVKDPTDLAGAVAAHEPGDQIVLTIHRGGEQLEILATLGTARTSTADPGTRGRTPRTGPG